jgi:hypothetical protein
VIPFTLQALQQLCGLATQAGDASTFAEVRVRALEKDLLELHRANIGLETTKEDLERTNDGLEAMNPLQLAAEAQVAGG